MWNYLRRQVLRVCTITYIVTFAREIRKLHGYNTALFLGLLGYKAVMLLHPYSILVPWTPQYVSLYSD